MGQLPDRGTRDLDSELWVLDLVVGKSHLTTLKRCEF